MRMNMDKQSRVLYFSTIGILLVGLCFAVLEPIISGGVVATEAVVIEAQSEAPTPSVDKVAQFIEDRNIMRKAERESLQAIIDDETTDPKLALEAGTRLMKILAWAEQETTIEGILRAREFGECVVTVHQDSVNVLVRAESLTRQQSAQILDVTSRETGQLGGNIKIMPIAQ